MIMTHLLYKSFKSHISLVDKPAGRIVSFPSLFLAVFHKHLYAQRLVCSFSSDFLLPSLLPPTLPQVLASQKQLEAKYKAAQTTAVSPHAHVHPTHTYTHKRTSINHAHFLTLHSLSQSH